MMEISEALLPGPKLCEWIEPGLREIAGQDPLGLQTITTDRILPALLPGVLALATEIEDLLLERAEYVDDEEWGKRIAKELGLAGVRLVKSAGFKNVSLVVDVIGAADPAHDPRMAELARRAMSLKKSDHVMLQAEGERFLLRLGAVARARVGNETHVSIEPLEKARLDAVAEQGGTIADLLGIAAA